MNKSGNFEDKYNEYFSKLNRTDLFKKAELLGLQEKGDSILIDFYDRQLLFNENGVTDPKDNPLTFAVRSVLCKYLLLCEAPLSENTGNLVTLREISNSGPLFSNVVTNTGKIIETTFAGNIAMLKQKCLELNGAVLKNNSYDLSVMFYALSKVPIILNFNDTDEMMPASAGFLFQDDAGHFLDLESLTILCTYLTGQLILQDHK